MDDPRCDAVDPSTGYRCDFSKGHDEAAGGPYMHGHDLGDGQWRWWLTVHVDERLLRILDEAERGNGG